MSYRYLGLISIALLIAGLWFVVWKWPQGKHMTFSQHAAQYKSATIYYFFLFAVTLPLLNIFFIKWFTPVHGLPIWFNVFAITASVFQIACTLVPEISGWRTEWHQALAGVSALLLVPLPMILASSSDVGIADRIVAVIALLVMLGVVVFAIRAQGKHPKLLIAQALYFAAFFMPILFMS
jgi:hypothetical protein